MERVNGRKDFKLFCSEHSTREIHILRSTLNFIVVSAASSLVFRPVHLYFFFHKSLLFPL